MAMRSGWAVLGAGALYACSSPAEMAEKVGGSAVAAAASSEASAQAQGTAGAAAAVAVAFADNETRGEASREFSYQWPAEVAAIPALAARFEAERTRLLAEQKQEWTQALAESAGQDCGACANHFYELGWEVVTDLPRFLSLSASFGVFTGGAHGMSGFDALVWDREAGAALDPKALFRSPEALQEALGAPWCRGLKAEKIKRLQGDYREDGFFPCPPIADLVVIVGSSSGTAFDRIGLLAGPYIAGSYAEGAYEVTLPVTPKVVAAVKPAYREAFALGR